MTDIWNTPAFSNMIISDSIKDVNFITKDIVDGKLKITVLIENMAGVLTNKEPENRAKGMSVFTEILKQLPNDYFSEMEIDFISKFYVDRLKDNHHVIPSVLEGFLYIVGMKNFNGTNVGPFFTALFREVQCQTQVREDRWSIYTIVRILLDNRIESLQVMGPDFIYGFISSMDGERDPRNLHLLFSFIPKLIKNIPLGHLTEEFFDIISCYFPVDFTPNKQDVSTVTRQHLADSLAPCLCAVPEFSEFCLPLIVEKMDSSLRMAKIDSMNLLVESFNVFAAESYCPFLSKIWELIQRELLHKTDEELKLVAHKTLYHLVEKLSKIENTDQTFENFIKKILITQQSALADVTTVQNFNEISHILLTCMNASKTACLLLGKTLIPSLIAYYKLNMSDKLQLATLGYIIKMYEMILKWNLSLELKIQLCEIPHWCLEAVSVQNVEFQIVGFRTLICVVELLESDLLVPFMDILVYNIHNTNIDSLLNVCIECMMAIAKKYSNEILNMVVINKLELNELCCNKKLFVNRLKLLIPLASQENFTHIIISKILELISDTSDAKTVINVLSKSIIDYYNDDAIDQLQEKYSLVDKVIDWIVRDIGICSADNFECGLKLITIIISRIDVEKQQMLIEKYTTTLLEQCKDNPVYIIIIEALYNSISCTLYSDSFKQIIEYGTYFALHCNENFVHERSCVLVAHILNKVSNDKFHDVHNVVSGILHEYCNGSMDEGHCLLININGWIVKALVMRCYSIYSQYFKQLIDFLKVEKCCKYVAEAIKLIMTDSDVALNVKCQCNVSFLYKQRIFEEFFLLSSGVDVMSNSNKECYYLCVAYIIGNVSTTLVKNNSERLISIVVESLYYENSQLLTIMLNILTLQLQTKHSNFALSLSSVVNRLITLSSNKSSMDVRIKSLECLYNIAALYPTELLLPLKQDVVYDLSQVLDDKKRLVRSAAVKARSRWFLVGEPGEEK